MPKKPSKAATPVATPRPEQGFELPPMDLPRRLHGRPAQALATEAELRETGAADLQGTLEDFNVMARAWWAGWRARRVTLVQRLTLPAGVRVSTRHRPRRTTSRWRSRPPACASSRPSPAPTSSASRCPTATRQTCVCPAMLAKAAGARAAAGGHRRGRGGPLPSSHDLAEDAPSC